ALFLLSPVVADAMPLTYRIDFHVEEIVSGCSDGLPCGHVPGENFSRTFTVESTIFDNQTSTVVALSSPLAMTNADDFLQFLNAKEIAIAKHSGSIDLAFLLPDKSSSCDRRLLGVCVYRSGMQFYFDDGHWFDRWTMEIAGLDYSGHVRGSYILTQIDPVP